MSTKAWPTDATILVVPYYREIPQREKHDTRGVQCRDCRLLCCVACESIAAAEILDPFKPVSYLCRECFMGYGLAQELLGGSL